MLRLDRSCKTLVIVEFLQWPHRNELGDSFCVYGNRRKIFLKIADAWFLATFLGLRIINLLKTLLLLQATVALPFQHQSDASATLSGLQLCTRRTNLTYLPNSLFDKQSGKND